MKLKSIGPYVPRGAFPALRSLHRVYLRILFRYIDLRDRRRSNEAQIVPLPPASLRYRVHGSVDADGFSKVGKKCSQDIEAALKKVGKEFDSFRSVLDFGCGCGRTLVWFLDRSPSVRLYGTDIDADAVAWCRDNLDSAEFSVNGALPPLDYPSETFDLVYAISVFTHLDEDYQFRWLSELKRITRPKGIVLLTVHGRRAWKDFPEDDVSDIQRKGFKFIASNAFKGVFPEWYQNAYHTKRYVVKRYSKYFDVLDYIPGGMSTRQDVVVLQKP